MRTEKYALRAAIFSAACLCMVCAAAGELAFPGAAGFGVQTPGGHDGRIIKVTNLNSDGPGSLRAALAVKGRRIVVFEVGGIIDLDSTILKISEPFITIAGQTAPSPGISIIRGGMIIEDTHDVVIATYASAPATPAANAYRDLVFNRWWTSTSTKADSDGVCRVRAFYGKHRVESLGQEKVIMLLKDEGRKTVTF